MSTNISSITFGMSVGAMAETSNNGYKSVFSAGVLDQKTASVELSSVSISPAAKLMSEIDALNQRLDNYQKAIASGDLTLSANALVALKQELLNFKVAVKNLETTFDIMDEMMDTLERMTQKVNNLQSQ